MLCTVWETDEASLFLFCHREPPSVQSKSFHGCEECAIIEVKMNTPILNPEFFSLRKNYAVCRPVGELSLDDAVRLIDDSLRFCKQHEITRLLANVTGATPFPSPSLTDRFWLVTRWAESARGLVILSVVAPADIIHPDKMGVVFAENRGLYADIFSDENEAVKWLCDVKD
jgi:hypothetical protein